MNNLITIENVKGYLDPGTGTAYLNAEDVARGFGYMTDGAVQNILNNPTAFIEILTEYKKVQDENKSLAVQNARQKQLIGELKPKADYTDLILKNRSLVTITQIAKDYGMSGQAMNKILHSLGIIYNQSGQWLLYSMDAKGPSILVRHAEERGYCSSYRERSMK